MTKKDLTDNDLNEKTMFLLTKFIAQYKKELDINPTAASKNTLNFFSKHLENNLHYTLYVTPLYNVKGSFDIICLSPDLYIRKATPDEYSKIVRLQSLPYEEIDQYQRRLKFILICKVPEYEPNPVPRVQEEYAFVLNLLKIFKNGNPQFGRLYTLDSEYLNTSEIVLNDPYYGSISAYEPIEITQQDVEKFCEFYTNVKKKSKLKNREFLINSIERFGMASTHRTIPNKIVDYVIALDVLLGENSSEMTMKIAHRVAALSSDSDDEILYLWEFMKKTYGFRSKFVHQSTTTTIKIHSREITQECISDDLYKIAKKSILRIINILDIYKNRADILHVLDQSIYDRRKLDELREAWKPSEL